nr:hypothetical protein Iba_chr12bCG16400 [Ipomoea batatas]GMD68505.1 hypothetical protein Iba_chr12dCG9810 [Ipomoea batatas]
MLVSTWKHSICCSTIILCIQKHSPIRCSKQRARQAQSSSTSFPHKKSCSKTYNAASQSAFGCLKALLSSPILSTPPYQSLATSTHVNLQMRCQPRSRRHAMQRHQ